MKRLRFGLALSIALGVAGCSLPPLELLPQCDYTERQEEERTFVLPSIEEAVGGGTEIYAAPRSATRIRLSTFAYAEELAGRKYKRMEEVTGEDGRYVRWLLEDCRVFYSRSGDAP